MSEGGAGPRPAAVAAAGAADGGHVEMEAEEEAWEEKKARLQRMLRQKLLILAAVYTPIVDEWLKDVADVARRLPFEFWERLVVMIQCRSYYSSLWRLEKDYRHFATLVEFLVQTMAHIHWPVRRVAVHWMVLRAMCAKVLSRRELDKLAWAALQQKTVVDHGYVPDPLQQTAGTTAASTRGTIARRVAVACGLQVPESSTMESVVEAAEAALGVPLHAFRRAALDLDSGMRSNPGAYSGSLGTVWAVDCVAVLIEEAVALAGHAQPSPGAAAHAVEGIVRDKASRLHLPRGTELLFLRMGFLPGGRLDDVRVYREGLARRTAQLEEAEEAAAAAASTHGTILPVKRSHNGMTMIKDAWERAAGKLPRQGKLIFEVPPADRRAGQPERVSGTVKPSGGKFALQASRDSGRQRMKASMELLSVPNKGSLQVAVLPDHQALREGEAERPVVRLAAAG